MSIRNMLSERLIPACAGTTHSVIYASVLIKAHPRLRGDHSATGFLLSFRGGSSPPARGPPQEDVMLVRQCRLIPACAGTTRRERDRGRRWWAHPRLRGDHKTTSDYPTADSGSSPPARGPLDKALDLRGDPRLIPACAGTTTCCGFTGCRVRAHPRLRGDHFLHP